MLCGLRGNKKQMANRGELWQAAVIFERRVCVSDLPGGWTAMFMLRTGRDETGSVPWFVQLLQSILGSLQIKCRRMRVSAA